MATRLFLESTWGLLAVLVGCQFALVSLWSWRRSRLLGRAVLVGLAIIPVLLVVSSVVVTQRERVIRLCEELADLVDRGEVTALSTYLSDDFSAGSMDASAFVDRLEDSLRRFHVDDPVLRGFEVAFADDGGCRVTFDASARIRSVDRFTDRVRSRWRVTLRRRGSTWEVSRLEALPTSFSPIRSLGDWLQ